MEGPVRWSHNGSQWLCCYTRQWIYHFISFFEKLIWHGCYILGKGLGISEYMEIITRVCTGVISTHVGACMYSQMWLFMYVSSQHSHVKEEQARERMWKRISKLSGMEGTDGELLTGQQTLELQWNISEECEAAGWRGEIMGCEVSSCSSAKLLQA